VVAEECDCEMRHALRVWGIQHAAVGHTEEGYQRLVGCAEMLI
jgi:hypothetical protein